MGQRIMSQAAKEIKTIFCDIDGCIFKHPGNIFDMTSVEKAEILPGVKETFAQWIDDGYRIILITGRPPSMFGVTHEQLLDNGLSYHDIIMGLPRGVRIVINDIKPDEDNITASGINLVRNRGMEDVDI